MRGLRPGGHSGGGAGAGEGRRGAGDILIDGGNSYYVDDIRLAKELAARQIHYIDRGEAEFGDKLLSAMRFEFGGHVEKPVRQ